MNIKKIKNKKATKTFFLQIFNLNLLLRRFYSIDHANSRIIPVVVYNNCSLQKDRILKESRNKAAIYRWVNNVNNKTYIGSSVNLSVRLYKYYSLKHLNERKTPIHNALLKYGFENFTLEILEYCEKELNPTIREQYYFSILKPEYNILEQAGSSLGYKHRDETLEFFKKERKASEETRKNLSLAATGRILTIEDKKKLSDLRKGAVLSMETRSKIAAAAVSLRGIAVLVKNIHTNEELEFVSLTTAAEYIGVSRPAVKKYVNTDKAIRGVYLVSTKEKS